MVFTPLRIIVLQYKVAKKLPRLSQRPDKLLDDGPAGYAALRRYVLQLCGEIRGEVKLRFAGKCGKQKIPRQPKPTG